MGRRLRSLAVLLAVGMLGLGLAWWATTAPTPQAVAVPEFKDDADRLPTPNEFAELARTDPVAMLAASLKRYGREVTSARAVLEKQERLKDTLHPPEVLRVSLREDPIAVSMRWISGARSSIGAKTVGVLYVAGQNEGNIVAWRPDALLLRNKQLDPKGSLASDASRYCIVDAGFKRTMLRTHQAWAERQKAGGLPFVYHGIRTPEKIGRPCHVIERLCPHREADAFSLDQAAPTDPVRIEREGFDRVTLFIDVETWVQLGTELKRANGELVGSYAFRDLEWNPKFAANEFTLEGLKAAP